jgi:FixJ family two-component response regulator
LELRVELLHRQKSSWSFASSLKSACLISDIQLGGASGLELQRRLASDGVSIPITFVTAHLVNGEVRKQVLKEGAVVFLTSGKERPSGENADPERYQPSDG